MKISELKNAPDWLKSAKVKDEDVEIIYGVVVWRGGEWLGGEWLGGVWRSGLWRGGEWQNGVWCGGLWRDGVWQNGEWQNGVWCGGLWRDGVWRGGEWQNGAWWNGEWCGGLWRTGEWRGGEWRGGVWWGGSSALRSKYTPLMEKNGYIKIGCKIKTIQEWDEFFASDIEYDTPRGTPEFQMIEAHYLATKAYMQHMNKHEH